MLEKLIPYLHQFLAPRLPEGLWHGDRTQPQIALTYDDGPHPRYTHSLLNVLAQQDTKATFFMIGSWVERYPNIAKAVYEQGHCIGLHGYTHRLFLQQSPQGLKDSLERTQEAIASACNASPAEFRTVRPPYGICRRRTLQQLIDWHYRPIMWSVVPIDWVRPGIETVTDRIIKYTQNGSIIALHDGSSGGQDVAAITGLALPRLKQKGFELIPIDRLRQ